MKIPRLGYWLSVIGIFVAILALGATELVLFVATAIYLLVAALRMRDMGNNPWWCLTALIPLIGLWVFLWLGFAKSRVDEVEPTEGVPGDEHEATVQAQNSSEGSTDRQRDQNAPQDVRRHQTTAKPVFVRQQPQRSERPFRPPETPSPGNRPTADEWFAVTSSEEPAGNDEQFEIEPSEEPANNEHQPKRQAKPILIGAGVLTLLAIATIATLSALIMTGDSNYLAKCDTWLQEQLVNSREATTNVENVNAVVAAIQDQRRKRECSRRRYSGPTCRRLFTHLMESSGNECLSRPQEQHRRQILHRGWDLPRRNGDHNHRRRAALVLPSRREPVVLAGRRQPANLGGAAHQHHATTAADRDSTTSSHSEATGNSINATNNAAPNAITITNTTQRRCSRPSPIN